MITKSSTQPAGFQEPTTGMGRFFSPKNLERYRKLAGGAISESEQQQLLEELVEEMNAFMREIRVAAVNRPPRPQNANGSQAGDQK